MSYCATCGSTINMSGGCPSCGTVASNNLDFLKNRDYSTALVTKGSYHRSVKKEFDAVRQLVKQARKGK